MAEGVGFEPTMPCGIHDFESCAFNRALPPLQVLTIKRLRESGKHSRLLVRHNPSQLQQGDRLMARKRQALKVVDRRIIVNGKKCDTNIQKTGIVAPMGPEGAAERRA